MVLQKHWAKQVQVLCQQVGQEKCTLPHPAELSCPSGWKPDSYRRGLRRAKAKAWPQPQRSLPVRRRTPCAPLSWGLEAAVKPGPLGIWLKVMDRRHSPRAATTGPLARPTAALCPRKHLAMGPG